MEEEPANAVISYTAGADQQIFVPSLFLKTMLESIIREKPITDRRLLIYLQTGSNELFFLLLCSFWQLKSDYGEEYQYRP